MNYSILVQTETACLQHYSQSDYKKKRKKTTTTKSSPICPIYVLQLFTIVSHLISVSVSYPSILTPYILNCWNFLENNKAVIIDILVIYTEMINPYLNIWSYLLLATAYQDFQACGYRLKKLSSHTVNANIGSLHGKFQWQ